MAQGELLYQKFQPTGSPANNVEGITIASASTITPTGYITVVTGGATVQTITVPYAGFSGTIVLVFTGTPAAFGLSGNVVGALTPIANAATYMTFVPSQNKWFASLAV